MTGALGAIASDAVVVTTDDTRFSVSSGAYTVTASFTTYGTIFFGSGADAWIGRWSAGKLYTPGSLRVGATSAPSATLDVTGTFAVSGAATLSGALTMDGTAPSVTAAGISVANRAATFLALRVTGEANSQFTLGADGAMTWGPGGATAVDTNLYRAASDVLKTDDNFLAAFSVTARVSASSQVKIGNFGPGSEAAITFGSGADSTIYRTGSAALRMNSALTIDGRAGVGAASSSTSQLLVVNTGSVSDVPLTVRGVASQFAPVQEWRTSASAFLASVSAAGGFVGSGSVAAYASLAGQVTIGGIGPANEAAIKFGSSGDANLYRQAAGVLQTTGVLSVGSSSTPTAGYTLDLGGSVLAQYASSSGSVAYFSATSGTYGGNGLIISVNRTATIAFTYLSCSSLSGGGFFVDGTGAIHSSSTSITAISDAKYKTNVVDLPDPLDAILALRPVEFDWKNAHRKGRDRGFVAQEVEKVLPHAVAETKIGGGGLGVRTGEFMPYLVGAIQRLDARLREMEAAA